MIRFILLLWFTVISGQGISEVKKVAGDYIVSSLKASSGGNIKITFDAVNKSGRYDKLILISDHVHMSIRGSDKVRISAEVVGTDADGSSIVSQVLVFLPSVQGPVPVWMLSRTHPPQRFSGARLLEMHAPSADYLVF